MKNLIKVCCFAAVLSLCICGAYKVLSLKDTMGLVGSSITQLEYTEDNMIDAVFVGSSHVFAGISPATMWNEFGIASFAMSVSGMDMDSTYYYLKNLLKTQSPKYVFVDIYSITFEKHAVEENLYRNMLSIPYSKNSYDLVNAYFDKDDDSRWDYLLKWPIIHTRYKEINFNDFKDLDLARYGRGERVEFASTGSINLEYLDVSDVASLDDKRLNWLQSLKNLSYREDFELIFCVIPYSVSYADKSYLNAVRQFANENGITYLDFNETIDEIGLNYTGDCSDSYHLNAYGAEKLSRWIGTYLVNERGIPTHQGQDGYDYWIQDYAYLAHKMSVNHLKYLYDVGARDDFFRTLNGIPGISYIVSIDGGNIETYNRYVNVMGILEVERDDTMSGGVWFKLRGEKLQKLEFIEGKPYYADLDEINSVRIYRDDNAEQTATLISNIQGTTNHYGMSISVYDNINHVFLGNFPW